MSEKCDFCEAQAVTLLAACAAHAKLLRNMRRTARKRASQLREAAQRLEKVNEMLTGEKR